MLSFVDVRCPHCGAQGKIVLPPLGTVLIGPCPQCKGMVALFNGTTLPLDSKIILDGTLEEKKKHIVDVFNAFIEEKVVEFFNPKKEGLSPQPDDANDSYKSEHRIEEYSHKKMKKNKPISRDEVMKFKESEIDLLDNPEIFRKYFSN
ncbi:MAG: hypothetical protein ACP5UA_06900 [Candidatus Hydrogenedens sp.]